MTPALFLALALTAASPAPPPGDHVTLSIQDYEALRAAQLRGSVTVIDLLQLGGRFADRSLSLRLEGRSSGNWPTEAVLEVPSGLLVYGCEGDALLSRAEDGRLQVTPLANRFRLTCRLATRGSDRVEMTATRAVLGVEPGVPDGEFVWGEEGKDGRRTFSVVRRVTTAEGRLAPSATGRYRVSLWPDETRFRYEIAVHNPNRAREPFAVALASGEHVQKVDASVPYEVKGGEYLFDLAPGEATLVLSGSLPRPELVPPVEASLQYVLVEAHPLLRPAVQGAAKRVSPREVSMAAEFRGSQAFLLTGREKLAWSVVKLEALSTTSYSLDVADSVVFFSPDGVAQGESTFSLDNQGSPDVTVPWDPEMTYAELGGQPMLLTRHAEGGRDALWLPIAQGKETLVVQHRQPFRRALGFGVASLRLPQPPVPASNGSLHLRYPKEWQRLYAGALGDAAYWSPEGPEVLGFVFILFWTERVLRWLGLATRARLTTALALTVAALSWGWAAFVLISALLVTSGRWAWVVTRRAGRSAAAAVATGLAALLLLLLVFAIAVPSLLRARRSVDYSSRAPSSEAATTAGEAQVYQGLPAKVTIPRGQDSDHFSREMLDMRTARPATVVLVSSQLLAVLQALLVLLGLWAAFRVRRELAAGWRAAGQAPTPQPEPQEGGLLG